MLPSRELLRGKSKTKICWFFISGFFENTEFLLQSTQAVHNFADRRETVYYFVKCTYFWVL